MKRQYIKFFKVEKIPIWELILKCLKNVIFVGDLIVPILESQKIEEIRFYQKEMVFIIDGKKRSYKYNHVRAIIAHSCNKKGDKSEIKIRIQFLADDGLKYNIELSENSKNVLLSKFSGNARDFLFQVAKKCPRLKEIRFKPSSNPLFAFGVAAMFVIIVLVE